MTTNAKLTIFLRVLWYLALVAILVAFAWMVSSCPCPPVPPPLAPVQVEKPCELPPVPVLPVARVVTACDPKLFCYDAEGAVAIVERDGKLRQWIKEVVARCGAKRAVEAKDAGSSRPAD